MICDLCKTDIEIECNGFCTECNKTDIVKAYVQYDVDYTNEDASDEGRPDTFMTFDKFCSNAFFTALGVR